MEEDRFAPGGAVTPKERRRALFELCVGYGLILLVIWTPRPVQRWLYWAPVVWIATVSWLSFPGWSALGLRRVNFLRSFWMVGVAAVLALGAALMARRLGTLHAPDGALLFVRTYIGYAVWSMVQQFLLLGFFLWRLLRVMRGTAWSVMASALIFALAHLPNPVLTPATLVWGLVSCMVFLRYRNLYPLGLAHAIFGIGIAISVPATVTHNMRVGLGYLSYRRPHPRHLHLGVPQRSQMDQRVSTQVWVMAEAPTRRS
jgi:hypothetical protein